MTIVHPFAIRWSHMAQSIANNEQIGDWQKLNFVCNTKLVFSTKEFMCQSNFEMDGPGINYYPVCEWKVQHLQNALG